MSDQTLTSAEEQRAWREWHDRSTGRCSDLLQLVNDAAASASAGAGSAATAASSTDPRNLVKSDTVIECLRQRWKARQPYTALGQASMVVVNPHDREQRIRVCVQLRCSVGRSLAITRPRTL